MHIATAVLLILSLFLVTFGLIPCLGALNWFGIPLCVVTMIVAIIGLAVDRESGTGKMRHSVLYILALVLAVAAIPIAALRLILGAGVG